MMAGAALGRCMIGCSSPGHSFPGNIGKGAKGYLFSGGNTSAKWYFGVGGPEGVGGDIKVHSTCWAMNYGLQEFVDSQLGWTLERSLPKELRAAHSATLLSSALALNPFNLALARVVPSDKWFKMMNGKQRYARHAWCAKDASSVVIDKLKKEYPLKPELPPADSKTTPAIETPQDVKQNELARITHEINRLNKDNANGKNQEKINKLNARADLLHAALEVEAKR